MKKRQSTFLAHTLVSGALALLGWVLYEPASLVSSLRLDAVASEAAIVIVALFVAGLGLTCGGVLLLGGRRRTEPVPN